MKLRRAITSVASAVALVGILGTAMVSCIDSTTVTLIACPPEDAFKGVSPVLEQRCGTIDCHGNTNRPMRIYGSIGMRAPDPAHANDPDYYPGGKTATTDLEINSNWRTVCALEPELMSAVTQGTATPDTLTFVRKPRLSEKHKGGRIWDQGKPGDRCLTSWLKPAEYMGGVFDPSDCITELQINQ